MGFLDKNRSTCSHGPFSQFDTDNVGILLSKAGIEYVVASDDGQLYTYDDGDDKVRQKAKEIVRNCRKRT